MDSTTKAPGLAGLTTLMNQQHVDPKLDTKQAEAATFATDRGSKMGDGKGDSMDEIYKLAKDLDIKIEGMDPDTISTGSHKKPLISRLENLSSTGSSYSSSASSHSTKKSRHSDKRSKHSHSINLATDTQPKSHHYQSSHRPPSSRGSKSYTSVVPVSHNPNKFVPSYNKPPLAPQQQYAPQMRYDRSTIAMTQEQVKKDHISGVLKEIRGETHNTFSTDVERIQDLKANKLEQIASLKMSLEEEGIDTVAIPNPSISAPIEEVDGVLNLLLRKNNRYRYASLAEEVISAGAEVLESVLDGNRTIPIVGWKPDYTGYSSTVNVKLHRLRFDTSQIVGDIIEKHNISPFSRILMELGPSLLLYPKIRQKQKTATVVSTLSSSNSNKAFNHIRDKTSPDVRANEWSDMSNV
jgi:hypothetical protein